MSDNETVDLDRQVVAAAIKIFASEATGQVTLKRVALEAQLPAEWVTGRWSSTTELLGAAIDRLADDLADAAVCDEVPTRGGALTPRQSELLDQLVHLVVRSAIDNVQAPDLAGRFPMIDQLIDQYVEAGVDLRTARYRAYQLLVVEFGWRIFSSQLLTVCGLDDESPDQVRAEIDSLEDLVAIRAVHPR